MKLSSLPIFRPDPGDRGEEVALEAHGPDALLHNWRERVVQSLLLALLAVGLLAVIAEVALTAHLQRWGLIVALGITYLVLVAITFIRRIPTAVRVTTLLALLYGLGVLGLSQSGLGGDGRMVMLVLPLLALTLVGSRAGAIVLGICTLTLVIAAALMSTGIWVPPMEPRSTEVLPWLSGVAVYLVLAGGLLIPVAYLINNLIQNLSRALRQQQERSREVEILSQNLEQQVAAQTEDLRERSSKLEAAAMVARQTAAIREVGQLLRTTVRMIARKFDCYHVAIFLIDEAEEFAVLRATSSEMGQEMMQQGYQVPLTDTAHPVSRIAVGQPWMVLESGASPMFVDHPDLTDTESRILLPLQVRGQLLGVLDIQSTQPRAFSEADVTTLQTMSDQVTLAIENARLLEESQRTLRELQVAHGEYTRATWDRMEVKPTFVYDQIEVVPADGSEHLSIDQALQTGQLIKSTDGRASLAAPLRLGEHVIGAIALEESEERLWTEEEIEVVQAVTEQVALALQSARLYSESQQRAAEQEGLARVAALASSTLEIDELLDQLMEEAKRLVSAESCALLLLDEEQQALVGRHISTRNISLPDPLDWHIPLDAPGFGQSIFARGGSYYSNQGADDPNIIPAYKPYMKALETRNFCGVALRIRERSIGEIYVLNRPGGFGRDELRLLRTVAGYVANAIENAQLFEQTVRRAEHERLISEITGKIRASSSLERIVETAAHELGQALGISKVRVRVGLDQAPEIAGRMDETPEENTE
jgi:GAF domain-containing protein